VRFLIWKGTFLVCNALVLLWNQVFQITEHFEPARIQKNVPQIFDCRNHDGVKGDAHFPLSKFYWYRMDNGHCC
jgi:hypothetical protein